MELYKKGLLKIRKIGKEIHKYSGEILIYPKKLLIWI